MAGLGSRFTFEGVKTPKPLIKVNGKSLIEHSVESLNIDGDYIFITRKYNDPNLNDELSRIFEKLNVKYKEINIDYNTSGAVETCLLAENLIENNDELIITNCDQLLLWNSNDFLNFISEDLDGAIVLFNSNDSKNSFAELENNLVIDIKEKKVISNNALVGIHYWRTAKLFFESAKELIKNCVDKERYISETYNYLINKNKQIMSKEKYNRLIYKYGSKMRNKVDDMHKKLSVFLCKKFETINLEKVSIKSMVSNLSSNLVDKTKRRLSALSIYKFYDRINIIKDKYGSKVNMINCFRTSKNCHSCGNTKENLGSSKIYRCDKCKIELDRDVNAAMNMYQGGITC